MKIETKKIKHVFTPEETAQLNSEFRRAVKTVHVIESEFDSVKAQYKAKTGEAEAQADALDAKLDAGFELRECKCAVVYLPKDRKKHYYLETQLVENELPQDAEPVLSEAMTDADLQMELVEAEAKFELREEIPLFPPAGSDAGLLIVGKQGGKWYAALRAIVGGRAIQERLDGEQPCCKKRPDAVARAVKRFAQWLHDALGKDAADGFAAGLDAIITAHKEREE